MKRIVISMLVIILSSCSIKENQPRNQFVAYILAKDTVPEERALKSLSARITSGQMTKKDGVNYVRIINSRKSQLVRQEQNQTARNILRKRRCEELRNYRSSDSIKDFLENSLTDAIFRKQDFEELNNFEVVESCKRGDRCHAFSRAIALSEDRYLIYHVVIISPEVGHREFVEFSIEDESVVIHNEVRLRPGYSLCTKISR